MSTQRITGVGIGFRSQHIPDFLASAALPAWVEVITENHLGPGLAEVGGRLKAALEVVRRDVPVVLHGVSLSIGSTDPLDGAYLGAVRRLIERIEPSLVSDHLCWGQSGGRNFHDLLPLPMTQASLVHVAERVSQVQDALGRSLVLENVSRYFQLRDDELPESEFLVGLVERTGCKLLLDVNNLYVNSRNFGFDPNAFLEALPRNAVAQMHLAGHSNAGGFLFDTHDGPVSDDVLALYAVALRRFGPVPTCVEWDENVPPLSQLLDEATRVEAVLRSNT